MTEGDSTTPQGGGIAEPKTSGGPRGAPDLSVVIPMYQEADRIGPTLRDVIATLDAWGLDAEVIAVDDGATDGSGELVERIAREAVSNGSNSAASVRVASQPRNMGKGAAVGRGLSESRGAWVLMMDADNSARLSELPKLAASADRVGAGFAVGSRVTNDADVKADPRRRAVGFVFRVVLMTLGLGYVRDTQCGFKLYRRDAAELCANHAREDGFAFDIEHLGLCTRAGLGVVEVGIRWEHREGGTIRVVRDGLRMLAQSFRIRARLGRAPRESSDEKPGLSALIELKPIPEATGDPRMVGAGVGSDRGSLP